MSANGRLASAELTHMGNGIYLSNGTAQAFSRMAADVKRSTGVTLRITPPDGGYRDWAMQQFRYDNPEGPVPIGRPGTSSHGMGRAVDISNFAAVLGWLRKYAGAHQFYQQFSSEPWHWAFTGAEVAGNTGSAITDQLTQRGAIDMPELYGTTAPLTPIPARMLAKNAGLKPGKATYLLLGGSPGTQFNAKITQDQVLVSAWAKQLAPTLQNPSAVIVNDIGWEQAVLWYDEALAPLKIDLAGLTPIGAGDSLSPAAIPEFTIQLTGSASPVPLTTRSS